MRTSTLALPFLAVTSLLVGCGALDPEPAAPTTTPFSMADAAEQGAALAPDDRMFLLFLDGAGIPHPDNLAAIAEGRSVCATLAATGGTRGEVAAAVFDGNRALVDAAADAYCPSFGLTASPTPAAPAGTVTTFGPGTYVVGTDIEPGTYRSAGPTAAGTCYWFRLKDTTGDRDSTLASNGSQGPTTVTIKSSDGAFQTSGCQQWTKAN